MVELANTAFCFKCTSFKEWPCISLNLKYKLKLKVKQLTYFYF